MVNSSSQAAALAEFAALLGAEGMLTDESSVEEYRDPFREQATSGEPPLAVLSPANVEEVQEVVRIASRYGVPMWTGSMSRNYGYGASEPRVPGSVIVSLRRMNRVLEIDDESGTVIIEPGVTFFDLYNALREAGSRLWLSVPDLGWGS
ncbi:FAD-dependent oxidoreductase, partial [Streptomyces sp. NPDC002896]|uniref:FAD-binding oxidoreductase n=1 Tax=Streptomyces sp. NPDC002896 TaxID=3154438 RepID=UPI003316F4D5